MRYICLMRMLSVILLAFIALSLTAKTNDEPMLHYIVRAPLIKSDKPPLIILMHGIGSNENDLFSFAGQLPGKFLVVSLRGPYTLGPDSYAWYQADFSKGEPIINKEQAEKSRNAIIHFIDQLKTKEQFDEKQVYLCGFSQGAIMSFSVGLTHPDKIKGIAVMSGRILDEVKPMITPTTQLKHLEVFISHGTKDKVIDVHYARKAAAYLNELGITGTYKEYDDVHTINKDMLADLVSWFGKR